MSANRTSSNGLRDEALGTLLQGLAKETSTLVRQEIALSKAEVSETGKRAGIGEGLIGAAGAVALAGLGARAATLILALATASWLAALIVTVLFCAAAGRLALVGRNRVRAATPPPLRPSKP